MKKLTAFVLALVLLLTSIQLGALAEGNPQRDAVKRYSVLVMDISDTAVFTQNNSTIYTANSAVPYVKKAAKSFLEDLINASGENYVAVVLFDNTASVLSGFTNDISGVITKVDKISASGGVRSIDEGLKAANNLINQIDDEDAIKNVILVTTGMTNGGSHLYAGHYGTSTIGSNWYRTDTNIHLYAYANASYNTAAALKEKATLYVLGLFQTMENMPAAGKDVAQFFRLTASELATSAATFFDVDDPDNIDFAFGEIVDEILGGHEMLHGYFDYRGKIDETGDTQSDYYYSDGYFFSDTYEKNPSLATMSLVLELSAWSSQEPSKTEWYNPRIVYVPGAIRPEVNHSYFSDYLVNVKTLLLGDPSRTTPQDKPYETGAINHDGSIENAYNGLGFSHFDAIRFWEDDPTKDSIGVCAARKKITDKRTGKEYTLVAVAVRGGGYGSEWASNFTLGSSGEHKGFSEAKSDVLEWLDEYLGNMKADEPKDIKLWLVGFSRAGITANMVAGEIDKNSHALKNVKIQPENLYCYTFEAPQGILEGTDTAYENNAIYGNIHNYRIREDLVPLVAPTVWDFTRYNKQNDFLLPNKFVSGYYDDYEASMKKQLREMGFGDFVDHKGWYSDILPNGKKGYDVSNVVTYDTVHWDLSKYLPFGDPLYWTVPVTSDTNYALTNGLNFLFNDVFISRTFYVQHLEDGIRELMGLFMHYDGALAEIRKDLSDEQQELLKLDVFMEHIGEFIDLDNIIYILAPMFNPFGDDALAKYEKTRRRANEVVTEILADYQFLLDIVPEYEEFQESLVNMLMDALLRIAGDALQNNSQDVNTLLGTVAVVREMGFQGHFPEICFAWVRSFDPYYSGSVQTYSQNATTRILRINCPVDVLIYDKDSNLVASIINEVPLSKDAGIIHYVNSNEEKLFYLPGDVAYKVVIKARDNGTVNVSVSELNLIHERITRLTNYYGIDVRKGDEIQGSLSALSLEEQRANSINGSSALYEVRHNGDLVDASEEFRGDQISSKPHSVAITIEGNGGLANGAGEYLQGSFARVEATLLPGAEFLGWYEDGRLLSEETVYRFPVRYDTQIVAQFNNIVGYNLKVQAEQGGTVEALDNFFAAGSEIQVQATPDTGWKFAGWTIDGSGVLVDDTRASTIFTMGKGDAVVTASFIPESYTGELPPMGDNSHIGLWFSLLLVSGWAVLVLRKKASTKQVS